MRALHVLLCTDCWPRNAFWGIYLVAQSVYCKQICTIWTRAALKKACFITRMELHDQQDKHVHRLQSQQVSFSETCPQILIVMEPQHIPVGEMDSGICLTVRGLCCIDVGYAASLVISFPNCQQSLVLDKMFSDSLFDVLSLWSHSWCRFKRLFTVSLNKNVFRQTHIPYCSWIQEQKGVIIVQIKE